MCGISIAAATLIGTAIAGATTIYSTVQQGKAQEAQLDYQAQVDQNNSILAQRQADDAIQRGQIAEDEQREKVKQLTSSQRVSFAANGIDLGSNVVGETIADTAMLGELDALTIRNNAEREAYGYKIQAQNYQSSSALNKSAASNVSNATALSAGTSFLSTASSVGSKYLDFKDAGAFD